jgi:polyisoprenoid-binding protein YceI
MLRRILIISGVAVLVVVIISVVVVRQLIFGGTPTIHPRHAPALAITPCPTLSAANGLRLFRIASQDSTASYTASFQAAGQPLPGSVMGITGDVSGEFMLTSDSQPHIQSLKIVVDLRSLDSGSSQRDQHVQNDTLETRKYPYAIFSVSDAQLLSGNYIEGQTVAFKLKGDLMMHGVTRPELFDMQGKLMGKMITGSASTLIHLPDFKMKPPQTTAVVTITVSNAVTLSLNFTAQQQSCSSGT